MTAPLKLALALVAAVVFGPSAEAARIQRVVSPGGIEAWLVEEHTVPLISVNFAFPGGNVQDPAGKEGVANLITTLMDEGAGDIVSADFQESTEELAMRLRFEDGREWMYGQMKALTEHRDQSFDLLALSLTRPRFDADAVERMKAAAISSLRREDKDPETVASRLWSDALYGDHPYRRPASGTVATVQALTADDVRAYHKRVFVRDGLKIGVVGDIDAATLGPLLDKVFGGLPARGDIRPVPDIVPKTGFTITKQLEIPQTIVRVSMPGIKRDDPDFMAGYVMNHILGGGSFSSWLYAEVREKRGLAYSVSTALSAHQHAGLFVAGSGTRNDAAAETLEIIKAQIRRMAEVGPTQDELDKAKSYLTGSYALRFDTSDKIADLLVSLQTDNLGIDYVDRRNALVQAVTLDDVRRISRRILTGEMGIVMVGAGAK